MNTRAEILKMEHAYIEQHAVAERYICNTLPDKERADFEQHLVDCQECMDRLLLAGMFHSSVVNKLQGKADAEPRPEGLVVRVKPRQLALLGVSSLLVLLAIVALVVWLFSR